MHDSWVTAAGGAGREGAGREGGAPGGDGDAPWVRSRAVSVSAYILIQTEVGKASDVVGACRDLPGVVQADDVTGPYDVILRAEAGSIDELGRMVVSQVQLVDGITRTLTCPVVNL